MTRLLVTLTLMLGVATPVTPAVAHIVGPDTLDEKNIDSENIDSETTDSETTDSETTDKDKLKPSVFKMAESDPNDEDISKKTSTLGEEKIKMAIVYGDDDAPEAEGDEIIVVARMPEAERYRVPEIFRGGSLTDPRNQAWANKIVTLERTGRFGTDTCSPVGLGGFTGCTQSLLASATAEREATDKDDWETRIAPERAKRMADIDANAAEMEQAVVAEEKGMAERARRAAEEESSAKEESITEAQSSAKEESTTEEESSAKEESTTEAQSSAKEESTTEAQSSAKEESTTEAQSSAKEKSTTEEQ